MRVIITGVMLLLFCLQGIVIAQDDAEATEAAEPPITITIWWPDMIARANDSDIESTLLLQADAFAAQYPNVTFDHRLKATGGQTGSIMSTLRTATNAARGALPTLTLIRRQDLLTAQANGYVQSLEGFSSLVIADFNNAITLGQVDNTLYGLPYMLNLQHVVYRPQADVDYDDWSFDAVLEREQSIIFPAGRVSGLNDVVALQYLDGASAASESMMEFDPLTLDSIFTYYQASVDTDLLTGDLLNITSSNSYLPDLANGDIDAGVLTSTQYLSLITDTERDNDDEMADLAIAPIPTESGTATTFLNGWIWVLTTTNEQEQVIAIDYLNYIFAPERQQAVALAIHALPSRERSITEGFSEIVDTNFYLDLIENGQLPLSDSNIGAVGREIQTQFATILTLEQSAEDAFQAVVNAVGE